jgi:putative phosphoribosyl transferase
MPAAASRRSFIPPRPAENPGPACGRVRMPGPAREARIGHIQFRDSREAGRQLAAQVLELAPEDPVVVALPRGGVPVGVEVARVLGAPLDILAVRKLGAPGDPEFAVEAIAEDGSAVVDIDTARLVGMTQELLDATLSREARELRRRIARY